MAQAHQKVLETQVRQLSNYVTSPQDARHQGKYQGRLLQIEPCAFIFLMFIEVWSFLSHMQSKCANLASDPMSFILRKIKFISYVYILS